MKRLLAFCLLCIFLLPVSPAAAADIYVAPNGNDQNPGTGNQPMATLAAALRKARTLRRLNDSSIRQGIHIIVRQGVYQLSETLRIYPEDAGTPASPTIIEAAPGEQPIVSGGIQINGWQKASGKIAGLPAAAQGQVWVAQLPVADGNMPAFRQLWVNGQKAVRAKNYNGSSMGRILSWNKKEESCTIPLAAAQSLLHLEGAEMFIHQWWAIAMLRIKKMVPMGDSAKLFFFQPESKIQSEHPWPAPWLSSETGNSAFYLSNAIQFLDEPGEWYMDPVKQLVYYWPRPGENPAAANTVAPLLETLVQAAGTIDQPVSDIIFRGISFQHTGWLRPSQMGHVPHQAGMYMLEAYKLSPPGTKEKPGLDNHAWIGRPAAAVQVSFAENTRFENCRFEHLAATGLDYHTGVHRNIVKGNLFKDIGGTALLAGVFSDPAHEIHKVYHPADEREVCDSMLISNNLVTDAGNEDWSCAGIAAGYTRNSIIEHNEIENVPGTGISMGWGWDAAENSMRNNRVTGNKIHHYGKHNYDCAGIYTLSAQPGSIINENEVDSICKAPYAHLPSHWFYLYTDEGSSGITVKDNWTASTKYLQNANGPGNHWSNNGPGTAAAIRRQSGLQQAYQLLAKEKTSTALVLPINKEHPEIIELVTAENTVPDLVKLKNFLQEEKIDSNAVYQWKNHCVVFAKIADVSVTAAKIGKLFPGALVKVYYDLFYQFDKATHCGNTGTAVEWDHSILTADLVADPVKQKEYFDYHATQFEKWPEVAQGFCNAGFQQLLVFRNGRQLMLVISTPKGKSLDELNPATTAGNPRMVEWNNRMKEYQQGIEGTQKGTSWVLLKHAQ